MTIARLKLPPFGIRNRVDAQILLMPAAARIGRGRKADVDYLRVHELHIQRALWRDIAREVAKELPSLKAGYYQWRRQVEKQLTTGLPGTPR
jgi:hypothetical protein